MSDQAFRSMMPALAAQGVHWSTVRLFFLLASVLLSVMSSSTASYAGNRAVVASAWEKCLRGEVSEAEADSVAGSIVNSPLAPPFEANNLSLPCRERISRGLYNKYTEPDSHKLVRYVWDEIFLDRVLVASYSERQRLTCDALCIFSQERKPFSNSKFFEKILRYTPSVQRTEIAFLLARSMVQNPPLNRERIAAALSLIPDDELRLRVVQSLLILGSPELIRSVAEVNSQRGAVCISSICTPMRRAPLPDDCHEILNILARTSEPSTAINIKIRAITDKTQIFENCVDNELRAGNIAQFAFTSAVFELRLFNEFLSLPDIVNGFRAGVFRSFSFLHQDIARIENISFPNLTAISEDFAGHLVDQLEIEPAFLISLESATATRFSNMVSYFPAAARLQVLFCMRDITSGSNCELKRIVHEKLSVFLDDARVK
jgi:hypothetical protein